MNLKTDTIIKQEGINREPFDYTKWRQEFLDKGLSVRELSQKAMTYSKNL